MNTYLCKVTVRWPESENRIVTSFEEKHIGIDAVAALENLRNGLPQGSVILSAVVHLTSQA